MRDVRKASGRSFVTLVLGVFGGITLAAGVNAPLIYIPIAGHISYLHHPGKFSGGNLGELIIPIVGCLSIVFALLKYFRLLWVTGTIALAQLAVTLAWFHHDMAVVAAQADRPDLVSPGLMWANAALEHARFEWGIAVIAGGAILVLAAAACAYIAQRQQKD